MRNLVLPECKHVTVFRAMCGIAQADPVLHGKVKTWVTWDGEIDKGLDLNNPTPKQCPLIILTPSWGGNGWYGPDSFDGPLEINVSMAVPGWHADDPFNLYFAFIRAFYPSNNALRVAIHQRLVTAGAKAHFLLQFTQPMGIDDRDGPVLLTAGRARIEVVETINP